MRCHICDSKIANPQYNEVLKEFEPCSTCLTAALDSVDHELEFTDADIDTLTGISPIDV